MPREQFTIGIDIGGTFTDIVLVSASGAVHMSKAATTPADPSQGVFDALERAARLLDTDLRGLLGMTVRVTHGSTVATNALLTRSGARVGLITTRGFEDTAFVMRAIGRVDGLQEEEVRHVAWLTKPEPLVRRALVRGVTERIDVRGEIVVPLQMADVERAVAELVGDHHVEALGVCLLNSWANPAHEERIREYLDGRAASNGGLYCVYSHRLARVAGEYARMNTVLVDCFVGPRVHTYLQRLDTELRRRGFEGRFLIMQGNGGLTTREQCTPVGTLQSGPAGGMLAAAYMAGILGHRRVLTTDMGGTSFDVGVYADGYWQYAEEPIFARFRILQPTMDVESIGAGGGTIARVNPEVGRLQVGPESAGADPAPACYGRGGTEPTVTDADVALGIIDPDYFLGGTQRLHPDRAAEALARVAVPLGMDTVEAADGIHRIINAKMADLIRRQMIRSGYLPEEFVLYAFGGAGPVHAVGFARDLGIKTIYVFPSSPVFSAFGIAAADVRHTRIMTCLYALPVDAARLNEPLAALEGELSEVMAREGFAPGDVVWRRFASVRFRRQAVGVDVELPWARFDGSTVRDLIALFGRKYEELYGTGAGNVDVGVEVGALRVDAIGPVPKPTLRTWPRTAEPPAAKGRRPVYLEGKFEEAPVFEWAQLRPGHRVGGPAVVESEFTTVLVPASAAGALDERGNFVLHLT